MRFKNTKITQKSQALAQARTLMNSFRCILLLNSVTELAGTD